MLPDIIKIQVISLCYYACSENTVAAKCDINQYKFNISIASSGHKGEH